MTSSGLAGVLGAKPYIVPFAMSNAPTAGAADVEEEALDVGGSVPIVGGAEVGGTVLDVGGSVWFDPTAVEGPDTVNDVSACDGASDPHETSATDTIRNASRLPLLCTGEYCLVVAHDATIIESAELH